ncbi:MAG: ABC transporter [Chloroflexi bacterium]|nr:MAG: ABC transporter [Chloroflexota bacterium]
MSGFVHSLKAVYIIWYREVLRYWRDKLRIIGSLARPFFFLVVFGGGLSHSMSGTMRMLPGGVMAPSLDFVKFLFPGIIGMTILFTSVMSGVSIIWDREFGFLKEILVAPIGRTAVALGKTLGGSTVAMIQGSIMLLFAPFIGIELSLGLLLRLWPLMFITSIALTSLGVLIAARMHSMEGFHMIVNFLLMPMFFLSGAFFPLRDLPSWMDILVKLNPLTYAIDALRQSIFRTMELPEMVLKLLPQAGLSLSVMGHNMTIMDDVAVILAFATVMLGVAVWAFSIRE